MRINVKINTDLLLECGFEFPLQVIYKFGYPAIMLVVFLTVADEDVVIISFNDAGHRISIISLSNLIFKKIYYNFIYLGGDINYLTIAGLNKLTTKCRS